MPVYNAEAFLREAIDSVLSQTYCNFELIVIDDGSSDGSAEILRSVHDRRLRVVSNGANRGLIYSLNTAIALAQGEYIARMDADDISMPDRFARQVAFLDSHREIAVCGTWFRTIGIRDRIHKHPVKHEEIVEDLLHVGCVIGHPTVMFRKSAVEEIQYESAFEHAEDYRLWARLSACHRLANIPEVGLLYRTHAEQVSESKAAAQRLAALRVQAFLASTAAPDLSVDERRWVERAFTGEGLFDVDEFERIQQALSNLIAENRRSGRFKQARYTRLLATVWLIACFRYAIDRRLSSRIYLKAPKPLLKAWPLLIRLGFGSLARRVAARAGRLIRGLLPARPRVIVKVSGDLASQMFQYSTGLAVSEVTGLKLVIDESDFRLFTRHKYLLGGWRLSGTQLMPNDSTVINYEVIHQRNTKGDLYSHVKNLDGTGSYLIGEWRSHRYFAEYRNRLKEEFRPVDRITSQRLSVIEDLHGQPSVVVLVTPASFAVQRNGVELGAWPASASQEFYEHAIDMLRRTEPQARVAVFISQRNAFSPPLLDMLRPNWVLSVDEQSPDDLFMMSHGRHFVIPASWFGWWVAWLGSSPGKRVIAPKQWRLLAPQADQPGMPGDWELI